MSLNEKLKSLDEQYQPGIMLKELAHEIAIETITGRTADLIVSFRDQFLDRGSLSAKQTKILLDIYKQHMG